MEGSLKRLKLDRIDLYQLHRIDSKVPFEKMFNFLAKVQDEGLVKHIGLSEVSIADIEKAQDFVNVISVQNKYSVTYRKWEDELEYCRENNIAFIPWNPINAGKLKSQENFNKLAKKYEASAFQLALSWLLHHSQNILLIPGTSKVKHLEENLKAADIELSQDDLEKINRINFEE